MLSQNSFKQAILKSKKQEFHEMHISFCIFVLLYGTKLTSSSLPAYIRPNVSISKPTPNLTMIRL